MGLDMYLEADVFLSEYIEQQRDLINEIKLNSEGMEDFQPCGVTYKLGYWRKANAIHNWFVENVQDGKDDCGRYYVSAEKLTELKAVCEKVLEDTKKAPGLLPVKAGFFFGSYDYEEGWYIESVRKTIAIIEKILANPDHETWSMYYQSSW